MVLVAIHKVAGQCQNVRLPIAAHIHDLEIEIAVGSSRKMQVAEVQDGEAIEGRRQTLQR